MRKHLIRKKAQGLVKKAYPYMLTVDIAAEDPDDPAIQDWALRMTVEHQESADALMELVDLMEKHPWLKDDIKNWG